MPDWPDTPASDISVAERHLLAGAERRMAAAIWVLGIVGTMLCWFSRGWRYGAGFAVGAALSGLNFRWMKSAVASIADLAAPPTSSESATPAPRPSSAGTVIRFVLRYALIGVAAYAIFKSSLVSLGAFFLGLFLFIGAILVEVAYEIYLAFRNT